MYTYAFSTHTRDANNTRTNLSQSNFLVVPPRCLLLFLPTLNYAYTYTHTHVYVHVLCMRVFENQYLLPSFTYFLNLLNNGFELVLRVFVVALLNFTLLSSDAMFAFVIVAHIFVSHTHLL